MSAFQVILLVFFSLALLAAAGMTARRMVPLRVGLLMILVAGTACVVTIVPEITTDIAKSLGIGRGTDLILYCAVVVMLTGFVMVYARLRHLRRELTLLVREIALQDAERTTSSAADRTGAADE